MYNTIKKELFEKDQVKDLEKNGILVRDSLIRPLAPESTKKFNPPGVFFNSPGTIIKN